MRNYHCTITHRPAPYSGPTDQGRDRSYHLVGTAEEIGEEVKRWITDALQGGGGPITLTPIYPLNVINLSKEKS